MKKLLEILTNLKPDVDFEKEENLVEDGILDSLEVVEIIDAIEKNYGKEISPEDIDPDNFASAKTIYAMICKL